MKKTKILILSLLFCLIPSLCFGVADDYYVTTTGAGDKSGTEWAKAFSITEFESDFESSAEAGDRYFIKEGTYTFVDNVSTTLDGNSTNPIQITGVVSATTAEPPTSSDWAYGSNRPVFTAGDYAFNIDDYWIVQNLIVNTTSANGLDMGRYGYVRNIKVYNSSGSANKYAVKHSDYDGSVVESELISTNGLALYGRNTNLLSSYLHDSTVCMTTSNDRDKIIGNTFDTCTTCLDLNVQSDIIFGNTFYACTTGIDGAATHQNVFLNNVFDECTTPASWSTERRNNLFDYNSWDGDSASNVNITEGSHSIDTDISLTSPTNGDFTLQSSSPALDAGMQLNTNIGTVGDYKVNIGVDQDDNVAGGGTAVGSISVSTNF